MSNVQTNLISRRSIYNFLKKEIDFEILERAFDAARYAPNHKQTNPWKFYIIGDKTREKLIPKVKELSIKKMSDLDSSSDEIVIQRAISKILEPPVLIAVTSKLTPGEPFREEEDYAATVCSLHNLVLSLWDQGIGTQWSTGTITRADETYKALDIPSDSERIIGFIKAGYPEKIPNKKKMSLIEIRSYLP